MDPINGTYALWESKFSKSSHTPGKKEAAVIILYTQNCSL